MATLAGSAIAQNVGKMDRFDEWKPGAGNTNWLLIAGASDPPESIGISKRRNRDCINNRSGSFLYGVTRDLGHMEAAIGGKPGRKLHNTVKNMRNLKKETVKDEIKDLFEVCKESNQVPILYYSGHGQAGTGDWCFSDGTLSILEIEALFIGSKYLLIISDACYSGNWANHCTKVAKVGYHCLAACPDFSTAIDHGEGGELTLWMCDKLGQGRPSTEPMCSKGNLNDFPITEGYTLIDYTEFLSSMMENTEMVLISQSVCDGKFSGIFAPHDQFNLRPAWYRTCPERGWGEKSTHEDFMQYVKELKSANKNIYSLACDDQFGFGVFAIQNFGTEQRVTCSSDMSNIQKWLDADYRITACGARHSTFYCVLTKGANGFSGKGQTYFRRESWQGTLEEINKKYKEGKRITSICYSTGLKKYLVVMTESAGQQTRWSTGNNKEDNKWRQERNAEGLHPTIVFKDPTNKKVLFVSTADENRTKACQIRYNYPLKK